MATHPQLQAQQRAVLGKKVRQLRRQGLLPGVVYGPAVEVPRPVAVDGKEFDRLYRHVGATTLVDLQVDGTTHTVFIRGVDRDSLGKELLHVDFYAPNLNEPTVVSVAINVVGELPASVDGVLTYGRQDVEIRALPENIPSQIEVDISGLDDEHRSIHVSDLQVPPGCEILTPGDEVVVQVAAPVVPAAVEPEAEEALAEELGDQPAALSEGAEPIEEE
ncbi:50S ribosomal protein L25 [Sphaerobacter sp.]|uniref:50S ribosomal protein L25 n=1 Tax=Sphaerobacter sp. TaxID=2099654 RepID=UPI001D9515E7|nr:50S ribosomal protein L25 [Sphaerobacter sp.]MBX5444738.1 50S ribosomal protein L25 [Sphaerobacter sp.]